MNSVDFMKGLRDKKAQEKNVAEKGFEENKEIINKWSGRKDIGGSKPDIFEAESFEIKPAQRKVVDGKMMTVKPAKRASYKEVMADPVKAQKAVETHNMKKGVESMERRAKREGTMLSDVEMKKLYPRYTKRLGETLDDYRKNADISQFVADVGDDELLAESILDIFEDKNMLSKEFRSLPRDKMREMSYKLLYNAPKNMVESIQKHYDNVVKANYLR